MTTTKQQHASNRSSWKHTLTQTYSYHNVAVKCERDPNAHTHRSTYRPSEGEGAKKKTRERARARANYIFIYTTTTPFCCMLSHFFFFCVYALFITTGVEKEPASAQYTHQHRMHAYIHIAFHTSIYLSVMWQCVKSDSDTPACAYRCICSIRIEQMNKYNTIYTIYVCLCAMRVWMGAYVYVRVGWISITSIHNCWICTTASEQWI